MASGSNVEMPCTKIRWNFFLNSSRPAWSSGGSWACRLRPVGGAYAGHIWAGGGTRPPLVARQFPKMMTMTSKYDITIKSHWKQNGCIGAKKKLKGQKKKKNPNVNETNMIEMRRESEIVMTKKKKCKSASNVTFKRYEWDRNRQIKTTWRSCESKEKEKRWRVGKMTRVWWK